MEILRKKQYNRIKELLQQLAFSNTLDARTWYTDNLKHCENLFRTILNAIYDSDFKNANEIAKNYPAIDLYSDENKMIAQVTHTLTKEKLTKSINHSYISNYTEYTYIFIYVGAELEKLEKFKKNNVEIDKNVHNLKFNADIGHIIGIEDILSKVEHLEIEKLKKILEEFEDKEITKSFSPSEKTSLQLAKLLNILKKIEKKDTYMDGTIDEFDLSEKMEFNNLKFYKRKVEDYKNYRVLLRGKRGIYTIQNSEGRINQREIYGKINTYYIETMRLLNNGVVIPIDGDIIFKNVFDTIKQDIKNSLEYENEIMTIEELEDNLWIVLVDAFLECKWFEKPPKKGD
ncbi:MAG: SMEK domain-containing protein [Defluviitaleaceae bacterium]|nr:SMEK domain-containing protein [Defluviitaleaceae bacterium]